MIINIKKPETLLFVIAFLIIFISGVIIKDNVLAIISALFGFIYTTLNGKGRISCYLFGIIATVLCGYIGFSVGLYGNSALHIFYYLPLEIIGIFNWKKHLKKDTKEVIKTCMNFKERITIAVLGIISTFLLYLLFEKLNDPCPVLDSALTIFSAIGMLLAVKRCIEQWFVWTVANSLSLIMWFSVFLKGEGVFSIFMVRTIYFILGIYFFFKWRKDFLECKILHPDN